MTKCRCSWCNSRNPEYVCYHDREWGRPVKDDQKLLEMLILECFQAGLSWECVLKKREAFREAFDGFSAEKISHYGEEKIASLKENSGIIRHEGKIRASVRNSTVFLQIQQEFGSFAEYLWGWTEGKTVRETGKTRSRLSDAISEDLKKRGMQFVGSTTLYAYLQAVGIIFGHEPGCFLSGQTENNCAVHQS